ncbi:MAG: single-stranded DNA-binding protein [Desulfobacteraceae bacterium]|nr:MAG: single-stranded DNA-binding protein [Desulfobacteraceae bacterium]
MASANLVILVGNLGKDPELRYTPSGKAVATFSMATTEKYKDQETTQWHRITAWNKLGEICSEYLRKGSSVYIEGKITYRSWDDKEGNKRYATDIIANKMQILSGGKGKSGGGSSHAEDREEPISIPEDDIPF